MTLLSRKHKRLERLLQIRDADCRALDLKLASARQKAESAKAQVRHVQQLVEDNRERQGTQPLASLRGGATLRSLLGPALDLMKDKAISSEQLCAVALRELHTAKNKRNRIEEDTARARRQAETEAEEQEATERPLLRKRSRS